MQIPEVITITKDQYKKPKRGPLTTLEKRRKAKPKPGKVSGNKTFYSDLEKMEAACAFAVSGNSARTSELTRIPEATIRTWKQTEWWNEIQARIVKEQDEETSSKLTKVFDKVIVEINDRLSDGDYVYNPKLDKVVRRKMAGKDLAIVGAVMLDKRQLLRGQPTSRTENVSQQDTLKRLADDFRKFVTATEVTQEQQPQITQITEAIEVKAS